MMIVHFDLVDQDTLIDSYVVGAMRVCWKLQYCHNSIFGCCIISTANIKVEVMAKSSLSRLSDYAPQKRL